MPVLPSNIDRTRHPLMKSFTPYYVPENTEVCDFIENMISISIVPNPKKTTLSYDIGAEYTYSNVVSIRNLTNNSNIKVAIMHDPKIFIVSETEFILGPVEEKNVVFELNKSQLNTFLGLSNNQQKISIRATNVSNERVINKDLNTKSYVTEMLPEVITVK